MGAARESLAKMKIFNPTGNRVMDVTGLTHRWRESTVYGGNHSAASRNDSRGIPGTGIRQGKPKGKGKGKGIIGDRIAVRDQEGIAP